MNHSTADLGIPQLKTVSRLRLMKHDTWLFRISLVWLAILAVGIPFAMHAMQ